MNKTCPTPTEATPYAHRLFRHLLFGVLATALLTFVAGAPEANESAPAASDPADLESLVATIEDPAKRAALVSQLNALIEAQRTTKPQSKPVSSAGAAALQTISAKFSKLSVQFGEAAGLLLDAPSLITEFTSGAQGDDQDWRGFWATMLLRVALILAAGFVGEFVVRRLLRRSMESISSTQRERYLARLPSAVGHAVLDFVCVGAFAFAAYAALAVAEPRETTRFVALALINANVIVRIPLALARALLAPRVSALRLVPLDDESANYWYIWLTRVVGLGVYGYFFVEVLLLLGVGAALHGVLLDLLALMLTAMAIVIIFQNRREVATIIRGDESASSRTLSLLRRRIADIWHVLATVYVIAVFVVWLLHLPGGFEFVARATALSVLVILVAFALSSSVRGALRRLTRPRPETHARFPGLQARANRYLPVVTNAVNLVVFVTAALSVLWSWNIDAIGWVGSETGRALGGSIASIVLIVVGALVVWEVVNASIERYVSDADGVERSARVKTLLPLARNALLVVMTIVVTLTVLSEIGINIGPLLAGAGVLGLAVGFGAQSLVKDIITGVFILLEDIISIGDFIEVGSHSGTVEGMSIRTIKLRDGAGNLHTVPFSEVASVLNYTKDFAFAVLDVGVAYRENVDDVIEVIKSIGEDMSLDEAVAPNILEPIQVLGLQELADSAVIIRARIKTPPGMQWATRREFNLRLKRKFDELGIEIPFPHQTVYFGADKEGRASPAYVRVERGQHEF